MSEQRLTDIAILSIERDLADSLILDDIVDEFAKKNRKVQPFLMVSVCNFFYLGMFCVYLDRHPCCHSGSQAPASVNRCM